MPRSKFAKSKRRKSPRTQAQIENFAIFRLKGMIVQLTTLDNEFPNLFKDTEDAKFSLRRCIRFIKEQQRERKGT